MSCSCGAPSSFHYSFVVPSGPRSGSRQMDGTIRQELPFSSRAHLLGGVPLLQSVEYAPEPWKLLSRVTLTPQKDEGAAARSFSFTVDREFMAMLREQDVLSISRWGRPGIGLSVLRHGQLVAAAGAITWLPLGPDVSVHVPHELVAQAEAIFRARNPNYRLFEYPLQVQVGDAVDVLHWGRPTMGDYEILIRRGCRPFPIGSESVSIERRGVCPDTAAHHTAQLLESEPVEVVTLDGETRSSAFGEY